MSEEEQFIQLCRRNGEGDLSSLVPSLLRRYGCVELNKFIATNNLEQEYLQLFDHLYPSGGTPQALRDFLQDVAQGAGYEDINHYFASQQDRSVTFMLGLGDESINPGADEIGERIRVALNPASAASWEPSAPNACHNQHIHGHHPPVDTPRGYDHQNIYRNLQKDLEVALAEIIDDDKDANTNDLRAILQSIQMATSNLDVFNDREKAKALYEEKKAIYDKEEEHLQSQFEEIDRKHERLKSAHKERIANAVEDKAEKLHAVETEYNKLIALEKSKKAIQEWTLEIQKNKLEVQKNELLQELERIKSEKKPLDQ